MGILIFMILASLGLALVFLVAFGWSVKSGQFDDVHTPGMRILLEDKDESNPN